MTRMARKARMTRMRRKACMTKRTRMIGMNGRTWAGIRDQREVKIKGWVERL